MPIDFGMIFRDSGPGPLTTAAEKIAGGFEKKWAREKAEKDKQDAIKLQGTLLKQKNDQAIALAERKAALQLENSKAMQIQENEAAVNKQAALNRAMVSSKLLERGQYRLGLSVLGEDLKEMGIDQETIVKAHEDGNTVFSDLLVDAAKVAKEDPQQSEIYIQAALASLNGYMDETQKMAVTGVRNISKQTSQSYTTTKLAAIKSGAIKDPNMTPEQAGAALNEVQGIANTKAEKAADLVVNKMAAKEEQKFKSGYKGNVGKLSSLKSKIDKLEKISGKIGAPGTGVMGLAEKGIVKGRSAIGAVSANEAEFQSEGALLRSLIPQMLGNQSKALSDKEQETADLSIPQFGDSEQVRKGKFKVLKDLLKIELGVNSILSDYPNANPMDARMLFDTKDMFMSAAMAKKATPEEAKKAWEIKVSKTLGKK